MESDAQQIASEGKQEIMVFDRKQQFLIQPDGFNRVKKTSVMSKVLTYLPRSRSGV